MSQLWPTQCVGSSARFLSYLPSSIVRSLNYLPNLLSVCDHYCMSSTRYRYLLIVPISSVSEYLLPSLPLTVSLQESSADRSGLLRGAWLTAYLLCCSYHADSGAGGCWPPSPPVKTSPPVLRIRLYEGPHSRHGAVA